MKTIVFVFVAGLFLLCLSGCQCGCLKGSSLPDSNVEAAYRDQLYPSYPVISTEMEIRAGYEKSF